MNEQRQIKVGEWTATPALNLLERNGHPRNIEPRAMDVLVYLAEHAGEVVSAENFLKVVWQGRTVGDGAVYQSINHLRHALGDGVDGDSYIQTIRGRGYRLIVPAEIIEPDPKNNTGDMTARWGRMLAAGIVGVVSAALAVFALHYLPLGGQVADLSPAPIDSRPVRRSRLDLGAAKLISGLSAHLAVSPDGTQLVYAAQLGNSQRRLYHRPLAGLETRSVPMTEGAEHPFFSPDGQWVAFYTDETDAQLKKIALNGGGPYALADAFLSTGGSWVAGNEIVYGTGDPSRGRSLFRVSASGGPPEPLIPPAPSSGHVRPEMLLDGNAVLFVIRPGTGGLAPARQGGIAVHSFETGETETLIDGGYAPRYSPTGHIIFARGGALWAVPFDAARLDKTGPETIVIEGVEQESFTGAASYAFSNDGLLVYVPGDDTATSERNTRTLVWVDRDGREENIGATPRQYRNPRLSPDGQHLAVTIAEGGAADVWTYDFRRNSWSQLTFHPAQDAGPLWTPDGSRVFFRSTRDANDVYWMAADGTGQPRRLLTGRDEKWVDSFSPDGQWLVFSNRIENGMEDLYLVSVDDDGLSRPFIEDEGNQDCATFSPDGRWIAYRSDETGRLEIYVRPLDDEMEPGRKRRISTDGGDEPFWGADGKELFYRNGDAMMSVRVETNGPVLSWDAPTVLFNGDYILSEDSTIVPFTSDVPNYAFSPDREHFLMMKPAEATGATATEQTSMVVVENWFKELNRLAPPSL